MQSIAPAPSHGQQDMNADNDLRAQLAAVISTSRQHQHAQQQQQQPHSNLAHSHQQNLPTHGYDGLPRSSSSPHGHSQHIDPAIAGSHNRSDNHSGLDDSMMDGESGGEDSTGDRKGGKRELSQSKRAAQNRAAQRAFRQRKESYIKQLEEKVRGMNSLEETFKAIQTENYSLREYIIHLQSRLIESQGEFPQPPANIDLSQPREPVVFPARETTPAFKLPPGFNPAHYRRDGGYRPPRDSGDEPLASPAPMDSQAMSQLRASAAQAVGIAETKDQGRPEPRSEHDKS